jgi:hypothetical protein
LERLSQVPLSRFGRTLEVWDLPPAAGDDQLTAAAAKVPKVPAAAATAAATVPPATAPAAARSVFRRVPLQESVPIGFDARPAGPRNVRATVTVTITITVSAPCRPPPCRPNHFPF